MRVEYCGPEKRWALIQDHIPILIKLDVRQAPDAQNIRRRYVLHRLNSQGLTAALKKLGWKNIECPLEGLQRALEEHLSRHCSKARPCPRAKPNWSSKAAELFAGAKRARRRYNETHQEENLQSYKSLSNQLKHEIRRNARGNWRRFVEKTTSDPSKPHNKGLWRLSR
jgi:hypothetical protein